MLEVIIISIAVVAIAFLAIGIKMFLKKGGEFEKKCSTIDPKTGKPIGCTCQKEKNSCENN